MSKSLEEQLPGEESNKLAKQAVKEDVTRADAAGLPPGFEPYFPMLKAISLEQVQELRREEATRLRREMVEQINANQRLEGYEPDEQLTQLQKRFIAGELTTSEMIETLATYAREIQKAQDRQKDDD